MTEPTDLVFPVEAPAPRAAVSHYQAGEVILAAQSICDGFFYFALRKGKACIGKMNPFVLEMMPGGGDRASLLGRESHEVVSDAGVKYRWEAFPRK